MVQVGNVDRVAYRRMVGVETSIPLESAVHIIDKELRFIAMYLVGKSALIRVELQLCTGFCIRS